MSDQSDELVQDIAKQIVEAVKSAATIEDGKAFERAALQNIVRVGNAVHAEHGAKVGRELRRAASERVLWVGKTATESPPPAA
jgi:hypothetical protein